MKKKKSLFIYTGAGSFISIDISTGIKNVWCNECDVFSVVHACVLEVKGSSEKVSCSQMLEEANVQGPLGNGQVQLSQA